jgi:triphosphatase
MTTAAIVAPGRGRGKAGLDRMSSQRSSDIELKLRIPPGELQRLLRHRALASLRTGKPTTKHLVSTYFDTPDFRLMRSRLALRVRQDGVRHIQTVKTSATSDGGPIARDGWETEISGDQPELDRLDDHKLRKLLRPKKIGGQLSAIFVTDIKRKSWPLKLDGSELKLDVDVGEITSEQGKVPICEAELGLVSGSVEGIYALARELRKDVQLVVEPLSKADRGYALVADRHPEPQRSKALELDHTATLGEAFLKIGRNGLHQLRANEGSMRASHDPEAVHQYRVALRRLRSAFTTFRRAIAEADRRRIGDDLRWLGRQFGRARELDVFIADLLSAVRENMPHDPALDAIGALAETARVDAYRRANAVLDSARYADLLLGLESWWEGGPWAAAAMPPWDSPALPFARNALRRLHRKLVKVGDRVGELSEHELHDLRLKAKKLRYAAEFFRGLFRDKAVSTYIGALGDIQDHLGTLNDSAVARHLLGELEQRKRGIDPELLARAAGVITGWISARVKADVEQLPEAWKQFSAVTPFWK